MIKQQRHHCKQLGRGAPCSLLYLSDPDPFLSLCPVNAAPAATWGPPSLPDSPALLCGTDRGAQCSRMEPLHHQQTKPGGSPGRAQNCPGARAGAPPQLSSQHHSTLSHCSPPHLHKQSPEPLCHIPDLPPRPGTGQLSHRTPTPLPSPLPWTHLSRHNQWPQPSVFRHPQPQD